ncbi:MAG: alpha/beta fold hydrolase [Gemmataceae bacterium]
MPRRRGVPPLASAGPLPRLADPIVLVHGICGMRALKVRRVVRREYFRGVPALLGSAGNRVYAATVNPTGGVEQRAADLKHFLLTHLPHERVHLVGHSMGGLDARYMVSRLGMESRVLSVTTVGTPHRGTPFADWGWRHLRRWVIPALDWVGLSHQAFIDLRTDTCARFNEQTPDAPGVRYFSVAGRSEKPWRGTEWELTWRIVNRAEGPNDGVVSVASAAWGEHEDVWEADHLNLINWPNRRARRRGVWAERAPDYGRIVRRLAAAGF